MKNWLYRTFSRYQRWMIGRYGSDELSRVLIGAALIVMLVSCIPQLAILSLVSWVLAFLSVYRTFSRNIGARSLELNKYMQIKGKLKSRPALYIRMFKERKQFKYFKCPKCKAYIRVPRGRGNLLITCTKCRHEINRRT